MEKQVIQFNKFKTIISFALRRLKIKSLDLYSYFKSRINRTSHRRRSAHSGSLGGYISFLRNWRKAAYTATVLLALTVMAILFPISFRSATPVEGATKDASPSSLSFSASSNTASVTLDLTGSSVSGGSFVSSSSNASFSIETNNATGYTLNIKTGNDTTTLSDGNNHTIPSIETSKTASNFTNNTWGLLPSKHEGSNNTTNYYPASSAGFTMDTTNSSNTGNANTYTVGLGLKADYTIPAGTYTNTTIVAEYVANPITYAIYYYSNTDDTVTGMPATNPQVPASSFPGTTATTTNLASAPTRTGYTFLGWCLGTSSSSNITVGTNGAADTCGDSSTNQFTAGQSFGINATGSSPDLYYFYAMWQAIIYTITIDNTNTTTSTNSLSILYGSSATVAVTPASGYYLSEVSCPSGVSCTGYNTGTSYTGAQTVTITNNTATTSSGTLSFVAEESKVYMQEMTMADCKKNVSNDIGENVTVYDKRDGKDYTVKYINGECWMTQNLRYLGDTGSTTKTMTIDNSNSNVTNKSITLYSLDSSNAGNFNAYSKHCDSTNSYNYACVYDSGSTSTGVWYNYYAASAGTISTNSNSTATSSDICPKNWHLPSGPNTTANTDINKLVGNTTSGWQAATTGLTAFGAVAGGVYRGGWLSAADFGYWWSATAFSATIHYGLIYNVQFFGDDDTFFDRYYGLFVRCVTEFNVQDSTKLNMQDIDSTALANLIPNTGDTTELVDSRDGQVYKVAKLADGKYWMTTNLNLAGGTALDADKTDVTSDYISSYSAGSSRLAKIDGKLVLPASSTSGFDTDNYSFVYNSGKITTSQSDCTSVKACNSYYSWDAATLGSGRSISTINQNAPYSICPKGWKLPTTYDGSGTAAGATDFRKLMIALGGSNSVQTYSSSTTPTGNTMYGKLIASPYNFLLAGYYSSSSLYSGGSNGRYWSATSYSSETNARGLSFSSANVYSAGNSSRKNGHSVRCVFGS